MRIESYSQIQKAYQTQKMARPQKTGTVAPADRVQISSIGKDFQTAKAAVSASPDIRENVTASIKSRIQDGSYKVSAESFADKLMQKYAEMR
ncbi:MAG: flagellar biosynthesis anti-sigma factor FlgM [Lachnospiraceae bacterium]|nr:flagellar biosynthesis anti-sigma factor FlgM [Lachnospiraceae bacterium]MBP5221567.1 flagellar biosynthesis anti-sigma factor FlgM [Lachnospiraceae bacterium]